MRWSVVVAVGLTFCLAGCPSSGPTGADSGSDGSAVMADSGSGIADASAGADASNGRDAAQPGPDAGNWMGGSCSEPDNNPCATASGGIGLCCSGMCTDTLADPNNCGECYLICSAPAVCESGQCVAPNCDGVPVGYGCSGNTGSQDPSERCVSGICVYANCSEAPPGGECAAPGADSGVGSCCAGSCATFDTPQNCGACGLTCATGASCGASGCSAPCTAATCPAGLVCVQSGTGGVCLLPSCSSATEGEYCSAAKATAGLCCSQTCVDTSSDPNNCGGCGMFCTPGSVCLYGSCIAAQDCATATPGTVCLNDDGGAGTCCGTCGNFNFDTDPLNCGGCGLICPQGTTCTQGYCSTSDGGYTSCEAPSGPTCGAGTSCVGSTCLTQICGASKAMVPCVAAGGEQGSCCGQACIDLLHDSNDCGACGNVCPGGTFCDSAPGGVQCVPVTGCTASNSGTDCPLSATQVGKCCSGACVDTLHDAANCLGCGQGCPVGSTCSSGCRFADSGYPDCDDVPGACPTGARCWGGGLCLTESCPVGASGIACSFGPNGDEGLCCNGACVDPKQDPNNCGSCGASCDGGLCFYSFLGGLAAQCLPSQPDTTCAFCPPGDICISRECVGSTCPGEFCAAGSGIGACCLGVLGGFTCVDLYTDAQNCGACGLACPAGQSCSQGVCSGWMPPCGAGHNDQYCSIDGGAYASALCCPGGGCTDITSDPNNCGYCGYACSPGLSCSNSQCLALSCSSSTTGQYCKLDGGLGTCCSLGCVDPGSDPQNCGGCGTKCANVETCRFGTCGVDQCTPTYTGTPCHADAGNYLYAGTCCSNTCVDTSSDPQNCGGCNLTCSGDGGCANGNCQ
jgi:hypothetical protein